MSGATVQKYAKYSTALDTIAQSAPELVPHILSGTCKISFENIVALAEKDTGELKELGQKIGKNPYAFARYSESRNAAAHFDLYQINPVKVSRRNGVSSFAGEPTSNVGKNFLRSYAGVCLQGVVIALACIIFSAVSSSPPAVDTSVSVVTAVWTYVGELAFNLLVLVGAVKGCDRIVKEIMGL